MRVNRCLQEDWFLLPYELRLQRAHARTLAAAGVYSVDECAAIEAALEQLTSQYASATAPPESDAEDLHTWIEAQLTELTGDAGRKIHAARSRNDQVATLLKLYVIDAGRQLAGALMRLARTACEQAERWAPLAFPLQTHNQFAAVGSVGFWALRYAAAFGRTRGRLASLNTEWRQYCPLGSGAVAGSSIPIDRNVQARELGFESPSLNALDSTTTRDECLDLLAVAAQIALHLQSFAADMIVFAQTPLAWTRYPRAFATGSSMMPNKLNPDAMELLRGECSAVAAAHGHAVLLLKGLPSGYNRDLQCIKPLVRDAVEKLLEMCRMTHAFLQDLDFDADRLAPTLELGAIDATLRMEQYVTDGMSMRAAHHKIADELADHGAPNSADVAALIARYQTIGSASPDETRRTAKEILAGLPEKDSD